jgi:hypothetical protein
MDAIISTSFIAVCEYVIACFTYTERQESRDSKFGEVKSEVQNGIK